MRPDAEHLRTRRRNRAGVYDYAQSGAYFITICTADRQRLFGSIVDSCMSLSWHGELVQAYWSNLPDYYPHIALDAFVVMPNHVHGVIVLEQMGQSVSNVVRGYKSMTARRINQARETPGHPVWQRSFHDHIIRSERDLEQIRGYIAANPHNWQMRRDNEWIP